MTSISPGDHVRTGPGAPFLDGYVVWSTGGMVGIASRKGATRSDWVSWRSEVKKIEMEPVMSGNLRFGEVLEGIKQGGRYARPGWDGEFIFLVKGSTFSVNREPLLSILGDGTKVDYRPHIDHRKADGTIGVWHESHDDLLARDWSAV